MTNKLLVDAVFVLSVRSFHDRIAHIERELALHQLPFEFIFDHDIVELDRSLLDEYFAPDCDIGLPQQSLLLKHLRAWEHCVARGYSRVLVLEDDVCLRRDFRARLNTALKAADDLRPGYLIFLGGADTRVPSSFFLESAPFIKNPIATADGYVNDSAACLRRIEWLRRHKARLPADHLIREIDAQCGTDQYWTTTPLVEQGSVFGLFPSTLDHGRKQNSALYNRMRYRWKVLQRRTIPSWTAKLLHHMRLR